MSVDICRTPHKPDYYVFVVTTSVIGYQIPPPHKRYNPVYQFVIDMARFWVLSMFVNIFTNFNPFFNQQFTL